MTKERDLEEVFRQIATAFNHEHPDNNDYYKWAREKIQENPSASVAFVDYVREMLVKSYGV